MAYSGDNCGHWQRWFAEAAASPPWPRTTCTGRPDRDGDAVTALLFHGRADRRQGVLDLLHALAALRREGRAVRLPVPGIGPAALGDHVDHRHVRDALDMLSQQHGLAVVRWDDLPSALRLAPHLRGVHRRRASPAETTAKLTACASYPTQLGFQFGSVTAMREALRPVPETFSEDPERVPGPWPGRGPGS